MSTVTPSHTNPIELILVDDHAMFREGLAQMIEKEPDLALVGQCSSCDEALQLIQENPSAFVLLDVDLGPTRALDFITAARSTSFAGRILILTAGISEQEGIQLVEVGVSGILHKEHSTDALFKTIRNIAAGDVALEQRYLRALFQAASRPRKSRSKALTERDKAVLRLVFNGLTNREMAERLGISEAAVKASLRLVSDKLGARTRAQLVKVALEQYRDQFRQ
ncbi:MAG TPA: response regulator transcription factor [Bryobacteraceae bacterium]|nr:response regulator transcription factor [Bryobacteraceae bacterium]